jgi:hypothetical protein
LRANELLNEVVLKGKRNEVSEKTAKAAYAAYIKVI